MEVNNWLKVASKELSAAGISSAQLDALILAEDQLGKDRAYLLAHPEIKLSEAQTKSLDRKLKRRLKHEPLAYIRGFCEFYGRRFKINKRVLEPRPESETMIELLKKLPLQAHPIMADVGTGSGAIGITAKLEIPTCEVDLYDIDSSCLAVARHNCALHELHLPGFKRDLLNRAARAYDIVLANLPYVPNRWKINEAAAMEPRIAIFGGPDGLDLYRRLFEQLSKMSIQPKFVLAESLPPQHEALQKIAQNYGYKLKTTEDFIQVFALN